MRLRTRLDVLRAALWSALGASQLVACGGSAVITGKDTGASGSAGSGNAGAGAMVTAGAATGGARNAGAATGGAGDAGANTSGGAGNAGGMSNRYPCDNPQDLQNGFVQCTGFVHRQTIGTCASHVPRPDPQPDLFIPSPCKFDADCVEHPYGWCTVGQSNETYCNYGCVSDSDCADDQLCDCAEPVGRCVPAGCTSDADCANGFLCRAYDASGGCEQIHFTCQTAADSCSTDADCMMTPPQGLSHDMCNFDPQANRFQCTFGGCAIGRPFLVEDAPRLATLAARADWLERAPDPLRTDIESSLRARLADQWTSVALMEHASIAAFARFTLQLISLGAPASLIERATAAMADETKHAKACFAVASSYAGEPLGPGRLAIERSLDESSLQAIVLNAIREGCVGETIAAIEARESAEYAVDPALRELLLQIGADESRHAELAYRFVKWALAEAGPELERAVRREFAALAAEVSPGPRPRNDQDEAPPCHGIVPDGLRQLIREQAITQVILPCSRALFTRKADTLQV